MIQAYDEFVDFIAGGFTPKDVVDFQPSQAAKDHFADLIYRQKTVGLSADETAEINHFLEIEYLMRLAKARARQRLNGN